MWHPVRRRELACLLGLASVLLAIVSAARAQAPAEPDRQRALPEIGREAALPAADAQRALDESPLDDERARAHFVAGESYFAAQRWDDAAHEFASAYEFSRRPEMLINLSLAHEHGGHKQAAAADLERLIAEHPDTPHRAQVEQSLASLREQLAAEAAARAVSAPAPSAASLSASAQVSARARMAPPSWPTWLAGGGALALASAALATGLRAHTLYGDLQARCPGARCDEGFEHDRDHGRALARASTGLTFAAVAFAGAAIGLWVRDVRARRERMALGFSFGAGHAEAQFGARF